MSTSSDLVPTSSDELAESRTSTSSLVSPFRGDEDEVEDGAKKSNKPTDLVSDEVTTSDATFTGYSREAVWDAWQRYCPTPPPENGEQGEQEEQASSDGADSVPPVPFDGEHQEQRGTRNNPLTWDVPDVPHVPSPSTPGTDFDEAAHGDLI